MRERQVYISMVEFKVVAIKDENDKLLHFIVTDRNGELATDKKFYRASDAISWGNLVYKGICDD